MHNLYRDDYFSQGVSLLGFSELLILIARSLGIEDMAYPMRFLLSVSIFMFFIMTGYELKPCREINSFLSEIRKDTLSILLPSLIVFLFIKSGLVFENHKVYLLWVLFSFYLIRFVYAAISCILIYVQSRHRMQILWLVMLVLGLVGSLLGFIFNRNIPADPDVILTAFLPALVGLLLRYFHEQYTVSPAFKIIILAAAAALFVLGIFTGQFTDPVNHTFPFVLFGNVVSIGSALLILRIAQYILKIPVIKDISTTLAIHPVLTLCIARLDTYVMRTWSMSYAVYTCFLRTIIDISFILIVSLAVNIIHPSRTSFIDQVQCRKYLKASDIYFYVAFACLMIRFTLTQTMILSSLPGDFVSNWVYTPSAFIAYSLVLVFAITLSSIEKRTQFFIELGIFAATQIWYHERSVFSIYCLLLLILTAASKDFKKILKIYFFTVLSILIIAWWTSLHGYVTNLIYYRDRVHRTSPRYALGANYVTDLASHWFYLITILCIAKPKRRDWRSFIVYPFLLYIAYYIFHVTDARLDAMATFAIIIITLLSHIMRYFHKGKVYRAISTAVGYIMSFSYLFCTALSFYLVANYNIRTMDMPLQAILGKFMDLNNLKQRLRISKTALADYSLNFFGNSSKYIEVGEGGVFKQPTNITFLDISYIKIPFMYGIMIAVILLTIWTIIIFRQARQKHLFLVLILMTIAFTGLIEHHLAECYYNIFSLALFTVNSASTNSSTQTKSLDKKKRAL